VLMFLKKGHFVPDEALISRTTQGYETKIPIGEPLSMEV